MKKVLITGGTGFVGQHITQLLLEKGYSVSILTRNSKSNLPNVFYYKWNLDQRYIDENAVLKADIIINLAGENIADKRWTNQRKAAILESRILPIQLICDVLKKHNKKLDVFISASAVGIYGNKSSDEICTEDSSFGTDFLSTVCQKWENEVAIISSLSIRTALIRTGLVLGNDGFLAKIKSLFNYKLGAVLGSGKQYMPWVYIDDLARMYVFAIENKEVSGAYNAAIDDKTTNAIFSKALAKLYGYSIWLPNVPGFILKLLLGEMSSIVLNGNRISSAKIEKEGFVFNYPNLDAALQNGIKK